MGWGNENLDWIFFVVFSSCSREFSTLNVIPNELEIKVVKIYRSLTYLHNTIYAKEEFQNHISMAEGAAVMSGISLASMKDCSQKNVQYFAPKRTRKSLHTLV